MQTLTVPGRRDAAFAALLLGMLMASLDTNVVVAALPTVRASLGGDAAGGSVAGVSAAYLLSIAVTTPLHGSLGDRWGRRRVFLASVVVFGVGSLACALAPDLALLTGFRALQGVGGSGLIVSAVAAAPELFDRTELLRRQGWSTAVFALSSVGGAPLGGFLAAGPGWPWIFLVNVPCCVLALVLGARSVPGRDPGRATPRRFDVAGAALIAVGGAGIVGLGSVAALARSALWAPMVLALAGAAFAGLVAVERRAAAPLIPPRILSRPELSRAVLVTLAGGVALFGSFTYMPLLLAEGIVDGGSPATVGLLLLPMSLGQLVATGCFSVLIRRREAPGAWGRLGLLAGTLGLLALALTPALPAGALRPAVAVAGLALCGAALGLSLQAYTLLAQSLAERDIVGATMATVTFTRQLGGSLGAAVFGWCTLLLPGTGGLSVVFSLAAGCLLVAMLLAPAEREQAP